MGVPLIGQQKWNLMCSCINSLVQNQWNTIIVRFCHDGRDNSFCALGTKCLKNAIVQIFHEFCLSYTICTYCVLIWSNNCYSPNSVFPVLSGVWIMYECKWKIMLRLPHSLKWIWQSPQTIYVSLYGYFNDKKAGLKAPPFYAFSVKTWLKIYCWLVKLVKYRYYSLYCSQKTV